MATTYRSFEQQNERTANPLLARVFTLNWYTIAYVAIFALAVFSRFYVLGDRVMSHDESLHTYYSNRIVEAGDFQHTPLMHGPILFHVTAFFYFMFGDNDFTSRLYPAILGVIMVMSPLLFRRWLGKYGALLASIMILISPLLLYYNRYIRHDTPSILSAILTAFAIFMYLDGPSHLKRKARWLYMIAGMMIWNLGSKETAFIYIALIGLFFTIYWLVRVYQRVTRRPSRSLFYFLTIPLLIAGAASLAMFAVFAIALSSYETLDQRFGYLSTQLNALFSGQPLGFDFNIFVTWTLLVIAVVVLVVLGTALYASLRGKGRTSIADIIVLLLLVLAASLVFVAVEEITQAPTRANTEVAVPEGEDAVVATSTGLSYTPLYAAWAVGALGVGAIIYITSRGWWRWFYRFREFDVLIIMGSLILPWLSPFVVKAMGADPTDISPQGIQNAVLALIPFAAIAIAAGLTWNWKRWLIAALVFHIPFAFFFTTMFTNPQGLATGMIGSLGYWLNQQGVERGSQPQYYYQLVVMPVYEYLPMFGALLAALAGLTRFWRFRRAENARVEMLREVAADERSVSRDDPRWLNRPSLVLFFAFLGVFNFVAYTLAGEKMPWLGTHITLPLIFLTAWYFGAVFRNNDWSLFWRRGWLYLLLIPVLGVALFQAAVPFLLGENLFGGLALDQQQQLYEWLAVVFVAVLVIVLIYIVATSTGFKHLRRMIGVAVFVGLALITTRHAWMASFINYDLANETLVYAHAAPGIRLMMEQIEELSERTTDGLNIDFAWGGNAWPVSWYFRDLTNARYFAENPSPQIIGDAAAVYASGDIRSRVEPLLEDRYYRFEYIRMWWPDQDYFYLSAPRVTNALDFSPENTQAAQIRRGLFDIWWDRDYSTYGQAVGRDYSLQNWPVSERLYFYVRKDIAAQIWNLGVGEGTVLNPLADLPTNVCTENWQQLNASVVFNTPQALVHPLDIAIDEENNRVYVAEEFGNQISVFTTEGEFVEAIVGGDAFVQPFQRPNGVAVAADGDLFVADTWNYRIRSFTDEGEVITGWGQPGQFGAAAQTEPVDGFWGPRDVDVDSEGLVYVADTGNKRIRVYDQDGTFVRDIGYAGSGLGALDEPSAVAVAPDGRVYVADTWNQRVSVFANDGTPLFTFPVRGWYEDLGNRPYLALDPSRNLVYVTDPDAGRVLVYDSLGNCVGSFGQPSDNPSNGSQFNTASGIAVDAAGNVYVTDAEAGRVLKFPPFVAEPVPVDEAALDEAAAEELPSDNANQDGLLEVTAEIMLPADETEVEVTPEATLEAVG